ncbi:hypothetical protein BGW39_010477 [Mortierella sp. 14UC]|nr:hypothetical protein BGW39_010477 [Mortierella sp. 14UC]
MSITRKYARLNGESKPSRTVQQPQQQPESRIGSSSFMAGAQDESYRGINSYPNPRTSMRASLTLLDTSASSLSNSILSRTRRASDRKMRQHQLEIQRDMAAPLTQQKPLADDTVESPTKSMRDDGKPNLRSQAGEDEVRRNDEVGRNDGVEAMDVKAKSSRQSSTINRSMRYSSQDTTSHLQQEQSQQDRSGSTSRSNRHSQLSNTTQRSSSTRQIQRVLSGPIFIPNPRGIAPTPSPDVSMELVRKPIDSTTPISKLQTGSQVVSKDQVVKHQELFRLYEAQLDARIRSVQENNRRLRELGSLDDHGKAMTIRGDRCEDDDDDGDSQYDDEEEERLRIGSIGSADLRLIEKAKVFMEESIFEQQRLDEELAQERSKNRELESRIDEMSSQLKSVLDIDMAQAKEIKLVHEQTVKDREQWKRDLLQEKQKSEALQSTLDAELEAKDRQFAESLGKERQSNVHENRALEVQVASLNRELEELKDQMRRDEITTQTKLDQQEDKIREHKAQRQDLEKQLEQERYHHADGQEAQVDDLLEAAEEREQDVQDLRAMLADYDEHLQSRQSELNEAMELVQSLQDQLQDHKVDHANDLQRIQDQHKKEQKQRQAEIRELKRQLAEEKGSSHEHQKRIELLLTSHQETTQMHEGKIRDLQEELNQRNAQLNQSKSTVSTVIKKAKGRKETINHQRRMVDEQEQILQEKENRIETLEQELKEAQQRQHTVVADMEEDLRTLEREREELVGMVKLARQQGIEDRDEKLKHDRDQERQVLEQILEELDPEFRLDSQLTEGSTEAGGEEGRRTASQLCALIQKKVLEQKQHLLDVAMQRGILEDKLDEQREQLDECEIEIESQHEQLLRLEQDRLELEDQYILLEENQAKLQDDNARLRQRQQEMESMKSSRNIPMSNRVSLSASRQRSNLRHDDDQVRELHDKISFLEQEKVQLHDRIKSLEESVLDLTEAGRTLRDKYEVRVERLRKESRQLVIRQEGQLFLYLSVIERLKMALRDAKIELPRDTKAVALPQDTKAAKQDPQN